MRYTRSVPKIPDLSSRLHVILQTQKDCAKTIEMVQKDFEDVCLVKTQIKHMRFKNDRTTIDSDIRFGQLSTTTPVKI